MKMKKEIMARFHKMEGMKIEGSKIPPQPKAEKTIKQEVKSK
jgi:hypothetical protein